jgi:hypothetical protein
MMVNCARCVSVKLNVAFAEAQDRARAGHLEMALDERCSADHVKGSGAGGGAGVGLGLGAGVGLGVGAGIGEGVGAGGGAVTAHVAVAEPVPPGPVALTTNVWVPTLMSVKELTAPAAQGVLGTPSSVHVRAVTPPPLSAKETAAVVAVELAGGADTKLITGASVCATTASTAASAFRTPPAPERPASPGTGVTVERI